VPRKRRPSSIRPTWTFSLWLTFQRDRTDAVGDLARVAAADPAWPGWRGYEGLAAHLRARRAPEAMLAALTEAYAEWEHARGEQ
jgi:hypothetical protein